MQADLNHHDAQALAQRLGLRWFVAGGTGHDTATGAAIGLVPEPAPTFWREVARADEENALLRELLERLTSAVEDTAPGLAESPGALEGLRAEAETIRAVLGPPNWHDFWFEAGGVSRVVTGPAAWAEVCGALGATAPVEARCAPWGQVVGGRRVPAFGIDGKERYWGEQLVSWSARVGMHTALFGGGC